MRYHHLEWRGKKREMEAGRATGPTWSESPFVPLVSMPAVMGYEWFQAVTFGWQALFVLSSLLFMHRLF